jgi:hypothetical protein
MKLLIVQLFFICTCNVLSQSNDSLQLNPLPFSIDSSKKMDDEELKNKKEGYFLTGLPEIENNPINGFGIGANFYIYDNGDKADPFFEYTPYRSKYSGFFKVFQSGKWQGAFNVDIPYIFDSKWRLRFDGVFENDPNFQYFGFGANTMNKLHFRNKTTDVYEIYTKFNPYFTNLAIVRNGNTALGESNIVTDRHYNELEYSEKLFNVFAERTFFNGRGRFIFGYELLFVGIKDYFGKIAEEAYNVNGNEQLGVLNGKTRLTEDYYGTTLDNPWQRYNIAGYNGGREGIFAFALMFDTRDFEPDPTSGYLIEYSHEHSRPWMFSEFSFDKNMLHFAFFEKVFTNQFRRMVFAMNGGIGYIWGSNIPFYEAMDLSSQAEAGGIEVLGGSRSLRGFREYRFVAPMTALLNVELRTRILQSDFLDQHFAFDVVPFFDIGRVWNEIKDFNFKDYRHSSGLGIRIAWNQSTLIRADYAISKESQQFFFGFAHIF